MSCSCHSARLLLKLIILVSTIIAFVLLEIYQIQKCSEFVDLSSCVNTNSTYGTVLHARSGTRHANIYTVNHEERDILFLTNFG